MQLNGNIARKNFYLFCALALVLFGSANTSHAIPISNTIVVTMQSGSDSGTWQTNVPLSGTETNWQLPSSVNVFSSSTPGLLLGTLSALTVSLDTDPQILLGFNVSAGNSDTNFTISSGTLSFAPVTNPQAFATAAITVTDGNSSIDGATATGAFLPGPKSYEAAYNGSSVFADLVTPVTAPTDSSNIGSERSPPGLGTTMIPGMVNSIQTQFQFTLTANDLASGTSRFSITPEPSSWALMLMAGVFLGWRARRRSR